MIKPLVTVITITFNCIKYGRKETLIQSIESVQNQDYENFEHIIIDGASSDGTLELLQNYPHLKVFSEPDKGVYDAFNKGVRRANGKYIVFVNSDDYFSTNKAISLSVDALEKNNADYSFATTYLLVEENHKLSSIRKPVVWKSFFKMPFCHQTMFCKVDMIKELGCFDENKKITSDYELYLKALFHGYKGVEVKEQIMTFRAGGMSDNVEGFKKERCELFKSIYAPFYELSAVQIGEIYENSYFPIGLAFKLAKYLRFSDRIRFLYEEIRRFIFQVRTSKKHRLVRVFGHRFV